MLAYASSQADDLIGTDIDSQSDQYVAELVMKLVDQASSVFLLIVGTREVPMGVANSLLNKLLRNKEKVSRAILQGEHEYAEKMLQPFREKFNRENNEEKIKELIRSFARNY